MTSATAIDEALLQRASDLVGAPLRLDRVLSAPDRRNFLARVRGPAGSYVLKQGRDPDGFACDWAGAQFLSGLRNAALKRYSPRFFGGDWPLRLIVLEDLGEDQADRSLVQALLGGDAIYAETGLLLMAETLGRLHADTMQRQAEYAAVYAAIDASRPYPRDELARYVAAQVAAAPARFDRLGVTLSPAARAEMREIPAAFAFDAPFSAFIHGDPCPDNCRFDARGYRLFDFEFGQIGHALLDATYGRTAWPTCWCCNRLPERVWRRMEAAYRRELVPGYPKAADDQVFGRGIVEALTFWTLEDLRRLADVEPADLPWGITTGRTRALDRFQTFAEAAAEFGEMPAFARDVTALRAALAGKWPETKPLPLFPAFRP